MSIRRFLNDHSVGVSCALLALSVITVGIGLWCASLPQLRFQVHSVTIPGAYDRVGQCVQEQLRQTRVLPACTELFAEGQALISTIQHADSQSTRMVFDVLSELRVVVALEQAQPGLSRASLVAFPSSDAARMLKDIVQACADSGD